MVGRGLTQRLARTGEPLLLPELRQASLAGRTLPAYAELCARFDLHGLLVVPLIGKGRVLGYLGVGRLRPGRPYGQAELALLRDFADRVAFAVSGARAAQRQVTARAEMEKFAALVERSRDFIAMADLDGRLIYLNRAGRELVGLTNLSEACSKTLDDFLTEEGRRTAAEVERPAVLSGGHWTGESELRHFRSAERIAVDVSSFLVTHPDTGVPLARATVQRDMRERRRATEALRDADHQRQELLAHLVRVQEDERRRIAADVHDDTLQVLAATDVRLQALRRRLAEPAVAEELATVQADLRAATARLRRLVFELEPAGLADWGLASALESHLTHLLRDDPLSWEVTGELPPETPYDVRLALFRIAAEAVANVRRHARARRLRIEIDSAAGDATLRVIDDGVGLPADAPPTRPGHFGLPGMRERAAAAGGSCRIEPGAEGGTVVAARLPIPRVGRADRTEAVG